VNSPTVISTFAGCGGSSLGYKMAGYSERLAVEWDDNAAATFAMNFPDVPIYHGDICELSADHCMQLAGISPGQLDVLDGSPPCQGFSFAGTRQLGDERNQLYHQYARLLSALQPKAFVMENVPGLVQGIMVPIYNAMIKTFRACGYRTASAILSAQYFEVPQARKRLIVIGARNDLNIVPSHPLPYSKPITAIEALRNVVIDEDERQMLLRAGEHGSYDCHTYMRPGTSRFDLTRRRGSKGFSARRQDPFAPSVTICRMDSNLRRYGLMHHSEKRRYTIAEAKRLTSFPDDFAFAGTFSDAMSRIGNSVPPLLMRAIALHVRHNILNV